MTVARVVPTPDTSVVSRSLRDPAGRLFEVDGELVRLIRPGSTDEVRALLESKVVRQAIQNGRVIETSALTDAELLARRGRGLPDEGARFALKHARVPFASFPHEWPEEMLHEAGQLTLTLAREVLSEHWGLKDATPWNVLFRGTTPVLVDFLSFERRSPKDPTWLPFGQFLRTFVLPLLAAKHLRVPLSMVFLTRREGLDPADIYPMLGFFRRLSPAFLSLVSLPHWLGRFGDGRGELYQRRESRSEDEARFILGAMLGICERRLRRAAPSPARRSVWTDYPSNTELYPPGGAQRKEAFVRKFLEQKRPAAVLDIGANEGAFSLIAAESGARVVAIDADAAVMGRLSRRAKERRLDVLPLVVDFARPSPAVGWNNREVPSFLDRARGHFDAVFLLAVVHHLTVTEAIPMPEVLEVVAGITRRWVVVELVGPTDGSSKRIARGRDVSHLAREVFESQCRERFDIVEQETIAGSDRHMYLLARR